MRIATIDKEKCHSEKCQKECINFCPINRKGDKCVYLGEDTKSRIEEDLCIGCGLCVKKCPFKAIDVVNTPEQLKEIPIHRFGENQFVLFRLPFPTKNEVVGLLGPNGMGKTTTLSILSGDIRPNMGSTEDAELSELIKIFRGTDLQSHLESLKEGKMKAVIKPQKVDILATVDRTVSELLDEHDERNVKEEVIKKLQLDACLDRKLKQLSGGELQRVAIAVAYSRKADIYYIDEPSSYLDVFQRLQVAKLLRELSSDASVMVVEHDLATLDFLADKIHVFYGSPGTYGIVSKPQSTRVGINQFLDGYIKEDNVRIRSEHIDFNLGRSSVMEEGETYLKWDDIEKTLDTFSLKVKSGSVHKGEILGIFGSNALGKTTFAKILAGEIKPDNGKVDHNVIISYKPQYISTGFSGTVSDLLQSNVDNIFSEEYKSMITRPLDLEKLMEKQVNHLSGGELQRVAIALALSKQADIYLLDEPSAYLDVEQRLAVAKAIRKLCEQKECSAMIIDHDLLFLSYLSDRAMVFSGESGRSAEAEQFELQEGFNRFLKEVDITFRKDPQTKRPRANKPDSQKDQEQKSANRYFYVE